MLPAWKPVGAKLPCACPPSWLVALLNAFASTGQTQLSPEEVASLGSGYNNKVYGPDSRKYVSPNGEGHVRPFGLGSDAALLLKLQKSHDVTTLSRSFVENYAKLTGRADIKALLEGEAYPIMFMLGDVHIGWDLPRGMALRSLRLVPSGAPRMFIAIPALRQPIS